MKRLFQLTAVVGLSAALCCTSAKQDDGFDNQLEATSLTLTPLFDNYATTEGVRTKHGFACLIETSERSILFDTGGDAGILMANIKRLGVDPKRFDAIVLSHDHGDHTKGLDAVLAENSEVAVWLPVSFPAKFGEIVAKAGARVQEVGRSAARISSSTATTGEMGKRRKEQALLTNTPKGLVVVTGCAHPGIVEIVRRAKSLTGEKVHLVLGGFHLTNESDGRLRRVLKKLQRLGVERVAPCHCSGDRLRELAEEIYGLNFIPNGVGTVIRI